MNLVNLHPHISRDIPPWTHYFWDICKPSNNLRIITSNREIFVFIFIFLCVSPLFYKFEFDTMSYSYHTCKGLLFYCFIWVPSNWLVFQLSGDIINYWPIIILCLDLFPPSFCVRLFKKKKNFGNHLFFYILLVKSLHFSTPLFQ